MTKKVLTLILMIITLIPVFSFAESIIRDKLLVDVKVEIKGGGQAEITGTQYMPKETIIKDKGVYKLDFSLCQPGERYEYKIKQTNMTNEDVIYDKSVYDLTVDIILDEEAMNIYAIAVIHKEDSETKPAEITFVNKEKEKFPAVKSGDIFSDWMTPSQILPWLSMIMIAILLLVSYTAVKMRNNNGRN